MNIDLSLFLRNVADMLDSDKLNNKELKLVGEFYMSFKFQNNVIDKLENNQENYEEIQNIEDADFIKFQLEKVN